MQNDDVHRWDTEQTPVQTSSNLYIPVEQSHSVRQSELNLQNVACMPTANRHQHGQTVIYRLAGITPYTDWTNNAGHCSERFGYFRPA